MSFQARLITAFLLCLQPAALQAAHETIRFNQASVDQGLSQSSVQAIAQDQDGFIWLGTQQGLNRYDGYNFVTYFHDPTRGDSLSHDWVWTIHASDDGILWVGTAGGGLNRLDPRTGVFGHFRHEPGNPESLGSDEVRAIVPDEHGRLWVGTDGGGVSRLDPETGIFKRFQHDPDDPTSLSSNRVKALSVDGSGFIWIGTDGGGLNRLDPVGERITRFALGEDNNSRVRSIVADNHGMLWVGTNERGLYTVDPMKGVARHFEHDPDDARSLSSSSIRVLFFDSLQQLWVGTDSHGLNRFDSVTGTFTRFRQEWANTRSLSDDHVASVFQDRGGVMWVGTHNGVNTWNPLMGAFRTYSRHGSGPGELSSNWITSFAEHMDGRLYVGTAGGGVNLVDLDSGVTQRVDLDGGVNLEDQDSRTAQRVGLDGEVSRLSDERVFALAVSPDNTLWVGTRAGGLNRYDPATGNWRVYRHDPDNPQSLSFDGVTSLLVDAEERLWVGTYLGGLNRYDPAIDGFRHYREAPGEAGSLCSDRVLAVHQDLAGDLWIGSHGGGLCRLDAQTGKFSVFRHDPEDPNSLSSNDAWAVAEDGSGNLWIGTADGGVNLWRARHRQAGEALFIRINAEHGLVSPVTYGLLTDMRGRAWIASNRGLSRIDGKSLLMRHYSVADGLQGNEFNFGAAFRARNGQLFFGGVAGFNAFFPERIGVNTHPPQVALTRFHRNYEVARLDDLRNVDGRLVLKHTDQLVAFEYAGLDFTSPRHNVYEHRLEGFDDAWVADDNRHRVTYTNLQPGDYELRVRAANNDGVWSTTELSIPLTVLPAPWATWWARTVYGLVLLLAGIGIYRLHVRKLERAAEKISMQASLLNQISKVELKETELARTRQRAQRYLDVVEVIILALAQDGTVTLVNQKGTRVLGYPEREILGRNFYDCFVPEEQRDDARARLGNVEEYAYWESPVKPREGSERLIAWHTIPLPAMDEGDAESAGGVLISGADVTQMHNLERQLRDAQKMEALGTLARGVAHDFNNILSSILGYAELSAAELGESSKAANYLSKLESSVERARDLVRRILAFGRGGGEAPEPVRVAETVLAALDLLKPVLGANIRIEESLDPQCGAVLADPTQLVQVVLNLCTNAGQAMLESGGVMRVAVQAYEVGIEEARSMAVLVPGPHVRLSVSDTGPGIDDFTLSRIFDPFFTTRRRDEGTGLGLAVVHGIVTQLRGTVQVFSEPGSGTRFDIYLPCCEGQPKEVTQEVDAPAQTLRGSETVLFVDDEPSVCRIAEEALGNLGYRVLTAADGIEALAIFDIPGNAVDVVVTDQMMPNLLGHKLAQAVKLRRPDVPVVLMSGAGRPASDAVDYFIDKPFSLAALGEAVRTVLSRVS